MNQNIKQVRVIIILTIISIFVTIVSSFHLHFLILLLYVIYLWIIDSNLSFQTILILSSFIIIDKIMLDTFILMLLYTTKQLYLQLMNHPIVICLFLLIRSIEYLLLLKYQDKLSYMIYQKNNKLHVLAGCLNFIIIITFYYLDLNLMSYNQTSFSYSLFLFLSVIIIYIFSSSYIYQSEVTAEIQETLRFYNYQYSYLEELFEMQKSYLKQNHDMRALLYQYHDKQDIKQYLKQEDILPVLITGDHTIDIVCNYYLRKYPFDLKINIKKKVEINPKIVMKVMDIVMVASLYKNTTIELYCDHMFLIKIILYNKESITISKEDQYFLLLNHFDLIVKKNQISIIRVNHS